MAYRLSTRTQASPMQAHAESAQIIPFPLARRLRRQPLGRDDLKAIETIYDAQEAGSAWRGFAAIGTAAVVLFTSFDRCPTLTLRRDAAGGYELVTADGRTLRRAGTVDGLLRVFARALQAG